MNVHPKVSIHVFPGNVEIFCIAIPVSARRDLVEKIVIEVSNIVKYYEQAIALWQK